MQVRVPASTANLGPGFDALGLALGLHVTVGTQGEPVDESHPAAAAHRAAGGDGRLSVSTRFPAGRGLGYSGAARVGGAMLAALSAGRSPAEARSSAVSVAAKLEGHPENAAASAYGGLVVASASRVVRVPVPPDLAVVLWIPDRETSTTQARNRLRETVPFDDAAFNVGRACLLVAALATGDKDALSDAAEDRLHQEARLAGAPASQKALAAMSSLQDVLAAWLSGSGPTVAGFTLSSVDPRSLADRLPGDGRVDVVAIDTAGAVVADESAGALGI